MVRYQRPNVSVAELLQGKRSSGETVRVVGRALSPTPQGFFLTEGPARLSVTLAPGNGGPPAENAWIGVEGRWHHGRERVEEARVWFRREPTLKMTEAANRGLPEASFLIDPWKLEAVRIRARLFRWVRTFLEERGFLAVQTPLLRSAPEVAYLEQCETRAVNGQTLYVRTDPEEYLKRYLTVGLEAVYEISTNVRKDWPDADHLQEFTSVECYRSFWTFSNALALSAELVSGALVALRGETATELHGRPVDLKLPLPVRTFADLVHDYAGIQLHRYPTAEALSAVIRRRRWWNGTGGALDRFRRTWLDWLLENRVIPALDSPTFVVDLPIEMGLSYREHSDRAGFCWRGELLLPGGFEVVHVYENLTEPVELRTRYEERLAYRIAGGFSPVALDEGLLTSAALGMPPMAGFAVGLDRLLMLVLGKGVVGEGLLFPHEGFI